MASKSKIAESTNTLIRTRAFTRYKVTKLYSNISHEIDNITQSKRKLFIDKLNHLKEELTSFDRQILADLVNSGVSDDFIQNSCDEAETYEDKIMEALILLQEQNRNTNDSLRPHISFNEQNDRDRNRLKLPQVPLPEFSNGRGQNFQKFIRGFESIVEKHDLSDYEKFIYLNKQLSGDAKILVESLDVDQQKYNTAKELLTKAFDSTLSSKYDIINDLANISLPPGSDAYPFIGKMRTILAGIRSQQISVDDICQFFIWNGLVKEFQSHLVHITNKSKPNLTEINEHIFDATERYVKEIEQNKTDKFRNKPKTDRLINSDTNTNAINIKTDNSKAFCVLCLYDKKDASHFLRNCMIYGNAKKKFDKLRAIKACTRCSFRNHEHKDCKFDLKSKCRFCQGLHMSYLCLKSDKSQTRAQLTIVEQSNEYEETANNSLMVEMAHSSLNTPVILPTFTTHITTENNRIPVRVFKDSGSQRTFVCESIAEHLSAPIIGDNIHLKIQGFNSKREIKTKLVSFNIEIGDQTHNINAICVNRIRTQFNAKGLDTVVKSFVNRGYNIADKQYLEDMFHVNNIDLIIGTDFDPILPMQYKSFGHGPQQSSYIESPIGVIFSGQLDNMISNIDYLPKNEPLNEKIEKDSICFVNSLNINSSRNGADVTNNNINNEIHSSSENDSPFSYQKMQDDPKVILSDNSSDNEVDYVKIPEDRESETNLKIIQYVLNNINRDIDGRIIAPLIWNNKNCHLLERARKTSFIR